MNDKEFRALEKEIQSHVDYWSARLGLTGWYIMVRVHRETGSSEATCQSSWSYKVAHLDFYAHSIDNMRGAEIPVEETVIHELLHATLAPLDKDQPEEEYARREIEHVVTTLSRALYEARHSDG